MPPGTCVRLIWFDNTRVFGTPSYYVQAMYSRNRPDVVLPVRIESKAGRALYVVAGRDEKAGEIVLDVVNPGGEAVAADIEFRGTGGFAPQAKRILLTSAGLDDENSLQAPSKVAPREEQVKVPGTSFQHAFPAPSLTILRLRETAKQLKTRSEAPSTEEK
jgi:alpha-N-arabinofuranosidase